MDSIRLKKEAPPALEKENPAVMPCVNSSDELLRNRWNRISGI